MPLEKGISNANWEGLRAKFQNYAFPYIINREKYHFQFFRLFNAIFNINSMKKIKKIPLKVPLKHHCLFKRGIKNTPRDLKWGFILYLR